MVLGARPADVETVIVGGDVVKRDGKLASDHAGRAFDLMHATRSICAPNQPGPRQEAGQLDEPWPDSGARTSRTSSISSEGVPAC